MDKVADDIKKDYGRVAKDYEVRWKGFVAPARAWVLSHLVRADDAYLRVLDLGCGTGECLSLIAAKYQQAEWSGFDLSSDMLDVAKGRLSDVPDVTLKNVDLETIKLQKEHYDVVTNLFVFHHIVNQEQFLQNMIKSTKSGGDVFIADYAIDSMPMFLGEIFWRLFLPSHYKAYSSKRFKAMLESHSDVEIIASERLSPNWFWRQQIYHLKKL